MECSTGILHHYFHVAKGEAGPDSGIRMVYKGTGCGLSNALWAPSFWTPTFVSAIHKISFYSWMMYLDMGEMFLKFPMDPAVRPYAGVDFKPLKKSIGAINESRQEGPVFLDDRERSWERLLMWVCSPVPSLQSNTCIWLSNLDWVTKGILEAPSCDGTVFDSIFREIHSLTPRFRL